MGALNSAVRIRHDLHFRLIEARKRTDDLFRIVREEAMYDRPIAERHRIIFYVGHVESFDWNLFANGRLGFNPSTKITINCSRSVSIPSAEDCRPISLQIGPRERKS